MDQEKSLDKQEDSAPPASFIQIKDIFDNNNNKPKLEETKYPYPNDNCINNSSEIIQNEINSYQSNENKTPQNLSCPTFYQGNNINKIMSSNELNTFDRDNNKNYNKTKNKNENILNPKYGDYFNDIMIISNRKKIFYCINHNKSFNCKKGLMSHCKDMHKFRCGKCGLFFGIKEKMKEHFRNCEKDELKENKNEYSECESMSDDDESINIHFGEMNDQKNQISSDEKNIFQKNKLEEDYNININNNKYEKPMIEKCENQDEEEKIKKQIELRNAEEIARKILLKRKKEEMDKQKALKRKKELKAQKKLKKTLKMQENLMKQEDSKVQEDSKRQEDTKVQEDLKAQEDSKRQEEELQRKEETNVFTCYKDGKIFRTKLGYIKHFATVHPNEYPFYCHICKYGTYSNNVLENHYRSKKHLAKFIKLYK